MELQLLSKGANPLPYPLIRFLQRSFLGLCIKLGLPSILYGTQFPPETENRKWYGFTLSDKALDIPDASGRQE